MDLEGMGSDSDGWLDMLQAGNEAFSFVSDAQLAMTQGVVFDPQPGSTLRPGAPDSIQQNIVQQNIFSLMRDQEDISVGAAATGGLSNIQGLPLTQQQGDGGIVLAQQQQLIQQQLQLIPQTNPMQPLPGTAHQLQQQVAGQGLQQQQQQPQQQVWGMQPLRMHQEAMPPAGVSLQLLHQQYAVTASCLAVTNSPMTLTPASCVPYLPAAYPTPGLQQQQQQQQQLQPQQLQELKVSTPAAAAGPISMVAFQPGQLQTQQQQQQQQSSSAEIAAAPAGGSSKRGGKRRGRPSRGGGHSSDGGAKPLTKSGDASRRYRARQRTMLSSLECEVADKLAQLQLLAAENDMLKLRASVLEATVASREDQMHVTQEHGPPVYDPASVKRSSSNGALPGSLAAAAAAPGLQQRGSSCPELEALHNLDAAAPSYSPDSSTCNTPAAATDGATSGAAASAGSMCGGGAVPLSSEDQQQPVQREKSSADIIKELTVDDIVKHCKQFLRELSHELLAVQQEQELRGGAAAAAAAGVGSSGPTSSGGFSSVSEQRLKDLTDRCGYLFRMAAELNPGAYCQLFGRNLDSGLPIPYNDAHWRQLVGRINLDTQQVRHILACSELYFSSISKLQRQRRALQQQLAARSSVAVDMLDFNANGRTPAEQVLDALASNLQREHVLRVMLNAFVWGEIFTPVQKAKAAIYSHPLFPDVHAIACVMCQDSLAARAAAGEPPLLVFPHRHNIRNFQQFITDQSVAMVHTGS